MLQSPWNIEMDENERKILDDLKSFSQHNFLEKVYRFLSSRQKCPRKMEREDIICSKWCNTSFLLQNHLSLYIPLFLMHCVKCRYLGQISKKLQRKKEWFLCVRVVSRTVALKLSQSENFNLLKKQIFLYPGDRVSKLAFL